MSDDLAVLTGATAEEDGRDGAQEDLEIEQEGPLVDIFKVESDPIGEVVHIISARYLPEAGHAWGNAQAAALVICSHGEGLVSRQGTRADKAHLPKENIKKLGEFIERGEAKEVTHLGNTRIFFNLKDRATHLIKSFELGLLHFGITHHGAKLVHGERGPVSTATLLSKNG